MAWIFLSKHVRKYFWYQFWASKKVVSFTWTFDIFRNSHQSVTTSHKKSYAFIPCHVKAIGLKMHTPICSLHHSRSCNIHITLISSPAFCFTYSAHTQKTEKLCMLRCNLSVSSPQQTWERERECGCEKIYFHERFGYLRSGHSIPWVPLDAEHRMASSCFKAGAYYKNTRPNYFDALLWDILYPVAPVCLWLCPRWLARDVRWFSNDDKLNTQTRTEAYQWQ